MSTISNSLCVIYPFKFIGWNWFAITDASVLFPDDNILRNSALA